VIRRPRTLRAEERRLWAEVVRAITPLDGRLLPEPEPAAAAAAPTRQTSLSRPAPQLPPTKAGPPPLAPLDRKVRTALRRGTLAVDSVIDLHGMRQAEAHGALVGFLRRARARDHGLVLVVTGKGAAGATGAAGGSDGPFGERGVLRRVVPHWLRLPDLRPLVLGFEEAAPQHGGSGALYVRLRRRRALSLCS
jgi:DNA-nicking Smr family endonuclease